MVRLTALVARSLDIDQGPYEDRAGTISKTGDTGHDTPSRRSVLVQRGTRSRLRENQSGAGKHPSSPLSSVDIPIGRFRVIRVGLPMSEPLRLYPHSRRFAKRIGRSEKCRYC
jgi:hypothetical protein